ncbi:MAG: ABC transporter substrate-binding protein [Pseudomonadota bacterium]
MRLQPLQVTAFPCAIVLYVALAAGAFASDPDSCIRDFDSQWDYFPDKAVVEYAHGFSVRYHRHYKVLSIQNPYDGVRDLLVLVQCGAPVPKLEGELATAPIISIPARTVGANEDLSLSRARVLGYAQHVVAMGGGGIFAPSLRQRWESGAAVSIGESFHGQPDYEKLLAAAPDVVFLSTASIARAESIRRARAIDIAAVPSMSWVEATVLGQAEWLQVVAIFFNEEAKANSILSGIKHRYRNLSEQARAQPSSPTVVWINPAEQRNKWVVPEANWLAQLLTDAGGLTPWVDPQGAPERTVTTEQVLKFAKATDAFITATVALGDPGALGALEGSPAIRQGRLFDVHHRSRPEQNAYDWYESAVVEVDRVLEDIVALLHPTLVPGHEFHHLRPLRNKSGR